MTREEALLFFGGVTDEDELEDAYETQLFEYKQFFLSKAPIAKLFESRLRKLQKLADAYATLTSAPATGETHHFQVPESADILGTFQSFQKAKNELKRLISNTASAAALGTLAEALVSLEKENASRWSTALDDEADIIVSKEPDPMYLLEAIQAYRQQGGETFAQLKNLENNPPQVLIQEMKRLSLLFKKF